MKKEKEIVGFTFNTIPLEEAQTMVLVGHGNYSDLKKQILETIPTLESDQAFSFGLPNGKEEVSEDQRRGICTALNLTLRQARLNWRATYASANKLFLVIPKTQPDPPQIIKRY